MLAVLLLHVTIAVSPGALPPPALAHAVAEAAAIWAPYGVRLDAADLCHEMTEPDAVRLTLVVDTTPVNSAAGHWRGALGAIDFDADGSPGRTITVYLDAVRRFMRNTLYLRGEEDRWPLALRDRIAGRIVGRVLAHEIGHYVLRTAGHAASGLMRPVHLADRLMEVSRHDFELTDEEAARLGVDVRHAGKRTGPAPAGPGRQARAKR